MLEPTLVPREWKWIPRLAATIWRTSNITNSLAKATSSRWLGPLCHPLITHSHRRSSSTAMTSTRTLLPARSSLRVYFPEEPQWTLICITTLILTLGSSPPSRLTNLATAERVDAWSCIANALLTTAFVDPNANAVAATTRLHSTVSVYTPSSKSWCATQMHLDKAKWLSQKVAWTKICTIITVFSIKAQPSPCQGRLQRCLTQPQTTGSITSKDVTAARPSARRTTASASRLESPAPSCVSATTATITRRMKMTKERDQKAKVSQFLTKKTWETARTSWFWTKVAKQPRCNGASSSVESQGSSRPWGKAASLVKTSWLQSAPNDPKKPGSSRSSHQLTVYLKASDEIG